MTKNEKIAVYNRYYVANELINSKLFKAYELRFIPEVALDWANQMNDYFINKLILRSALKVAINNNIDTRNFYEKLAENENLILQQHLNDEDFIKTTILGEMMEYYKNAKNILKYEEIKKEYTRVKSLTKLSLIEIPQNAEINRLLNEEINRNLKIILKWDANKIFSYFSIHTELFPDIESIVAQATKNYNESFLRVVTSSVFDINGNVKTLTDEEGLDQEKYKYFQISLSISVLPVFIRTMQEGVINFKISYNQLYSYLLENSWFGQQLPKMKLKVRGEEEFYCWLDLLAPALHNFLMQLEASFLFGFENPYSNYILSIDSLTLKFEGALRDFIRFLGGSSSILKNNEIREMLLEDLLNSDTAKIHFSENDLALFKMVFTNKGDNIRNNVAHCFYQSGEYRLEMICKVFLCILRLGAYKLRLIQ